MLRDIRELIDSPEEYAAELRRRWGGLLSYRYIGRNYAVMDVVTGQHRHAAPRHAQRVRRLVVRRSRDLGTGKRRACPIWKRCRTRSSTRARSSTPAATCGASRSSPKSSRSVGRWASAVPKIVDADNHDRVLALTEGQGVTIGTPPEGLERMEAEPDRDRRFPRPPAAVAGVRRLPPARRRPLGLPELAVEFASPDAALHIGPAIRRPGDCGDRRRGRGRGHRPPARRLART